MKTVILAFCNFLFAGTLLVPFVSSVELPQYLFLYLPLAIIFVSMVIQYSLARNLTHGAELLRVQGRAGELEKEKDEAEKEIKQLKSELEILKKAPSEQAQLVSFWVSCKRRLARFYYDDVSAYTDAQVGAAARVVHSGCKGVFKEYLDIQPVSSA